MELTVVIPTFNRRRVLERTLERLRDQRTESEYEVVVVDDGSTDGSALAARELAAESSIPMRVLEQSNAGPATARNRGLAAASGSVVLFLGDDMWPRNDLVQRHVAFHRKRPEPEAALLGQVVWARESEPSALMEWLNSSGLQFGYQFIEDPEDVPADFFYTSNVSVKAALVRSESGFDEAFRDAALEDTELGFRLEAAGMRLFYESAAIAEHYHPVDLPGTLERLKKVGRAARVLIARRPEWHWFADWHAPLERGPRTIAKKAVLTAFHAAGVRPQRVRHATWWSLCQEAFQSGLAGDPGRERIDWLERQLRHYAAKDPATLTNALPLGD